ncbi:MAG: hypothetical protein WED87_07730 [Dehalococcoidia bacterium]
MSERIDDLLQEAIATGTIPEGATETERAEMQGLLEAMGLVVEARSHVGQEAAASMPTARARFQHHVAASQPTRGRITIDANSRPRMLPWGRLLPRGLTMALAGSAAAIGVLALAAVVLWRTTLNDPPSAYAQVVEPGDYVQVEGVIEENAKGQLSVQSALGDLDVEAQLATLMGADPVRGVPGLKPGDRVLISGIAGKGRELVAQTVAVSEERPERPPRVINFRQLRRLQAALEGDVVTFTISNDGSRGAVLIEAEDGNQYLVPVDGESAARLLEQASTALGERVRVVEESNVTSGAFTLELPAEPGTDDRLELVNIRGEITNAAIGPAPTHAGAPDILLTVQTLRGPVDVRVPETARSLVGRSGLTAGPRLLARAVGHTVSITGGNDAATGQVVADALVLGPKVERPAR